MGTFFRFQLGDLLLAAGFLFLQLLNAALEVEYGGIRNGYFLFSFKLLALPALLVVAQGFEALFLLLEAFFLFFHHIAQRIQLIGHGFKHLSFFFYLFLCKLNGGG